VSAAPELEDRPEPDPYHVAEEEIDAVLYEAKGDPREAIRMLLQDLTVMAFDADSASSRGFLQGRFSQGKRRLQVVPEDK
jgi:hypothetical protein